MNKLFIVLLAICLVSVHAFVKRDAPAETTKNDFEKQLEQIKAQLLSLGESITKSVDPEQIKKGFNDAVDSVSKAITNAQQAIPK